MTYDKTSIDVLKNRQAVRQRPGMYIGDTHESGLHHILWEIVDNAVDEAMNGHADCIQVTRHSEDCVSVNDNGRGIPVEEHPELEESTLSVVFKTLHAGGKFDDQAYKTSGGLHGVGAAVTNFLSEDFVARSRRDEVIYEVGFDQGNQIQELKKVDTYSKYSEGASSGTRITFRPDEEIFETTSFDFNTIREVLERKTYVNPGLKVEYRDEVEDASFEFHHPEGIREYLHAFLEDDANPIHPDGISLSGEEGNVQFDVVFQWTDDSSGEVESFVNSIPTDGGTHEKGFLSGLSGAVKSYIDRSGAAPNHIDIRKSDVEEGLFAVLNLLYEGEIQFQGQTKDRFNNPEVRGVISSKVEQDLQTYLINHSDTAEDIAERVVQAAKARRKDRSVSVDLNDSDTHQEIHLPTKLSDCSSDSPEECELFIVEGASAGGNAKQARDKNTQAVLPLKGKPLNAENRSVDRIMKNNELRSMVESLGCGIGDPFSIENLRYGKVILLMDADHDGHHIVTLLLNFFYRHLPGLIEEGIVHIAKPPLFQVIHGKDRHWAMDDKERRALVKKLRDKDSRKNIEVLRFKGLGEMEKESLKETTMDPSNRKLIQVNSEDCDELFANILGRGSDYRYEMIKNHQT